MSDVVLSPNPNVPVTGAKPVNIEGSESQIEVIKSVPGVVSIKVLDSLHGDRASAACFKIVRISDTRVAVWFTAAEDKQNRVVTHDGRSDFVELLELKLREWHRSLKDKPRSVTNSHSKPSSSSPNQGHIRTLGLITNSLQSEARFMLMPSRSRSKSVPKVPTLYLTTVGKHGLTPRLLAIYRAPTGTVYFIEWVPYQDVTHELFTQLLGDACVKQGIAFEGLLPVGQIPGSRSLLKLWEPSDSPHKAPLAGLAGGTPGLSRQHAIARHNNERC